MRTNIDIDDELISEAMAATGATTKKAVVEQGLRLLVRNRELKQALKNLEGIGWGGNLDEMREEWSFKDRE